MLIRWNWPCVTKKGEKGPFQDPFKDFTYYRSENHGSVVGNVLWIPFLCIGHIMAKRQSVGTTAVVRELANSLDKGSAEKSASQRTICGWMPSEAAPFEISKLESSLCTNEVENCGTGITTVGTGKGKDLQDLRGNGGWAPNFWYFYTCDRSAENPTSNPFLKITHNKTASDTLFPQQTKRKGPARVSFTDFFCSWSMK